MTLSDQALSAVMIALQKSIMEQSDIVPVLKSFLFKAHGEDLYVANPPTTIQAPPPQFVTE